MKTKRIFFRLAVMILSGIFAAFDFLPVWAMQDDTVIIRDVSVPPVIDGMGDDACWSNVAWQAIDQVWINYGETIDPSDYNGRYKTIWSSKENLVYFLVEINDDIAIDGFIEGGGTADVYNYDIIEVFLDENKSGGPHINDNPSTGENAENAFGYHIYADFPGEGEVNKTYWVGDIPAPLTQHLPEFAIRKTGELSTREFSLKVYNDTYEASNPEASRVILTAGKIMGLSLAYCDNDEDDGQRDNFFGSVWVTAVNYNNHWMNADDYGTAKLYSDIVNRITEIQDLHSLQGYPNPVSDYIWLAADTDIESVEILDISGKTITELLMQHSNRAQITVSGLAGGIYLTRILCHDAGICIGKFIKF
jgi:hypothetical protein